MQRCAVLSCLGLGDGLIALVLSNNLRLNGYHVDTFHPFLAQLQGWFPQLPIHPFPQEEVWEQYDHLFFIYERSLWMQRALEYCQREFPSKVIVLNPIATQRTDYPYWEGGRFDGRLSFVDNLYQFCVNGLQLKVTTKSNGMLPPTDLVSRNASCRVLIHPTSSRAGKNWSMHKYLRLDKRLKMEGFHPVFTLSAKERGEWEDKGIEVPHIDTLDALAALVYESGYMIGNDSGVGHLASCCGVPTVTICRNHDVARFWRPGWTVNQVVTPPLFLPNLKWLRWRDKHWKHWISVNRVLAGFHHLVRSNVHCTTPRY